MAASSSSPGTSVNRQVKTCHQCRQHRSSATACKDTERRQKKLKHLRYGVVQSADRDICNCSICRAKPGHLPMGNLSHKAKAAGYSSRKLGIPPFLNYCMPKISTDSMDLVLRASAEVNRMVRSLEMREVPRAFLNEQMHRLANEAFPDRDKPVEQELWTQYMQLATAFVVEALELNDKVILEIDLESDTSQISSLRVLGKGCR
ncbi:hypothetical protein DCAR_0519678 [Daucus carota subsp. sativus]|uniref:Zinc-finger domain-containing protein n=1 Tax=Daucus carota subsp. sativus TaxID=79200 RepID=A0A161XQU2_DAUCS|nr:hypothetical protein DCAR_0519678 [Daucus carota subsp. sativus]